VWLAEVELVNVAKVPSPAMLAVAPRRRGRKQLLRTRTPPTPAGWPQVVSGGSPVHPVASKISGRFIGGIGR
jgi:hypothetical protein